MAIYNLTQEEKEIVVDFLYEPFGYLDFIERESDGKSAKQILKEEPTTNIDDWIRTNTLKASVTVNGITEDSDSIGSQLHWWILNNDGVNIDPANLPSESNDWKTEINGFVASINSGLSRVGAIERNTTSKKLYYTNELFLKNVPSGDHLTIQLSLYNKVLGVLS